jgi:FkbM family methyltransferase
MSNIKTIVRTEELEFCEDDKWIWPEVDEGSWKGPVKDWNHSHSKLYFKNLKNKSVVVTAGANMGLHVRAYSGMFQHVFAFEPFWISFYCLVRNCPYENVKFFNAALGSKSGWCNMDTTNQTNMGAHRIDADKPDGKVPMMTIDDLNLWDCGLIQLDVEGWEDKVLKGSINTIEQFRPLVIVERNCDQVRKILETRGYVYQERSKADSIFYYKG